MEKKKRKERKRYNINGDYIVIKLFLTKTDQQGLSIYKNIFLDKQREMGTDKSFKLSLLLKNLLRKELRRNKLSYEKMIDSSY